MEPIKWSPPVLIVGAGAGVVLLAILAFFALPPAGHEFVDAFSKSFLWGVRRSAAGQAAWGVNNLPLCEDPNVTDMGKEILAKGNPAPLQIYTLEKIGYSKQPGPQDPASECEARAITSAGKGRLQYTYKKLPDGSLYLEARFYLDN